MCIFRRKKVAKQTTEPQVPPLPEEEKTKETPKTSGYLCDYGIFIPNSSDANIALCLNDKLILNGFGTYQAEKIQVGLCENPILSDEGSLFGPIVAAKKLVQTASEQNPIDSVLRLVHNYLENYSSHKQEARENEDLLFTSYVSLVQADKELNLAQVGNLNIYLYDGIDLTTDGFLKYGEDKLVGEDNYVAYHNGVTFKEGVLLCSLNISKNPILLNKIKEYLAKPELIAKLGQELKRLTQKAEPFAYVLIRKES